MSLTLLVQVMKARTAAKESAIRDGIAAAEDRANGDSFVMPREVIERNHAGYIEYYDAGFKEGYKRYLDCVKAETMLTDENRAYYLRLCRDGAVSKTKAFVDEASQSSWGFLQAWRDRSAMEQTAKDGAEAAETKFRRHDIEPYSAEDIDRDKPENRKLGYIHAYAFAAFMRCSKKIDTSQDDDITVQSCRLDAIAETMAAIDEGKLKREH